MLTAKCQMPARLWSKWLSFITGENANWYRQFLTKPSPLLPQNSTITLLVIYPKKLKCMTHKSWHTNTYSNFIFITVKTWKQSWCPSVGEWLNKLLHQIMKYYLVKKKEPQSHEKTWKKLNCILLNGRRQSVTDMFNSNCMIV